MADSKITALASIGTGTDPANDPLVIVDVSDVSPGGMSATGTTKKVTLNNLLACSPTATLASATVTGDLTVKTNVLKVDTTNNRVGIINASPAYPLDVNGAIQTTSGSAAGLFQWAYGASASSRSWRAWNDVSANGDFQISTSTTRTGSTYSDRYRIDVSGVHEWSNTSGLAMTLNSTGLGVGTASPAQKVDVNGAMLATNVYLRSDDSDVSWGAGAGSRPIIRGNQTNNTIKFYTASTDRMTLDATGNLGIGVVPSALTNVNRLEIGGQLSSNVTLRSTSTSSSARNWMVGANMNSFGDFVIRQGNSQGAEPNSGTDRLVIDLNGNPIFTPSSTPATLTTNGQLTVNATSNTNLRFSYRGSDGVTRVANITLA